MEWSEILNLESLNFIKNVSYEEGWRIERFFSLLEYRIKDINILLILAKEWHNLDSHEQARLAVHHAGMFHATRFIILMDYLDLKYKRGELK
jgi:hypothetical protein